MKLTLDEVKDLGGNESDMELLKGIDSDDDEGDEETVVGLTDSETPEASLVDELKRLIHSPDKVSPTPEQKAANKTVQQNIAKLVKKKFPKKLLFNPAETWYDIQLPLLQEKVSDDIKEQYTEKLFDLAHSLYEAQADIYRESPLYSMKLISSNLLGMANKKSRREAIMAIDSVKDLMVETVLPDRKLRFFKDQPLLCEDLTHNHLILYYFEDALKKLYFGFVQLVEQLSKDTLLHVKNKMLLYVYDLLAAKPEQEQNLLALLVNKLGDQDRKIASKSVHLLSNLLQKHPNMKMVVIKETEQILFRLNINQRTQYYALTFLNQIVLSKGDPDLIAANRLIEVYFRLFEVLVSKIKKPKTASRSTHNEVVDGIDSKMLSAILTGINRAFPYSKIDSDVFKNRIDMLFTLSHVKASFSTCVQSLTLLFRIQEVHQGITDRYYRALYQSLLDKRILTASRQALFLNLLFRSLKSDNSMDRVCSFVKRMLQVCSMLGTPFVCATIFLIGQLAKSKPGILTMIKVEEDGDEVFVDARDPDDDAENDSKLEPSEVGNKQSSRYDGLKRDPLYSAAKSSCLWELVCSRIV
ncbi:MAG: hypothetical protein SGCHY_003409 [Lobulomycetales sp.]